VLVHEGDDDVDEVGQLSDVVCDLVVVVGLSPVIPREKAAPRKSRNSSQLPRSAAASPTEKVKVGGCPLTMNEPSAAVNPPRKVATSVAGRTVVVPSAESPTSDRKITAEL
jgi:hypothetical protein